MNLWLLEVAHTIALMGAGCLCTLMGQRFSRRMALRREARSRCGWCGRVRPHAPGQACSECQASITKQVNAAGSWTAAAPADWPKA